MEEPPNRDFELQLIIETLLDSDFGDIVTFSELSSLTGLEIQFEYRWVLYRALEHLLSEHNIVFENVRNVGYRKMDNGDIVRSAAAIKRVRSAADKGIRKLSCANWDELETHQRHTHNAKMTVLLMAKTISTEKSVKAIEGRILDQVRSIEEIKKTVGAILEEISDKKS